jgi:hypothetical protein
MGGVPPGKTDANLTATVAKAEEMVLRKKEEKRRMVRPEGVEPPTWCRSLAITK